MTWTERRSTSLWNFSRWNSAASTNAPVSHDDIMIKTTKTPSLTSTTSNFAPTAVIPATTTTTTTSNSSSFSMFKKSHSVDVDCTSGPKKPSLKRAQSAMAMKLSSYMEAMIMNSTGSTITSSSSTGSSDNTLKKHVRFEKEQKLCQEIQRPMTSEEEKKQYHYSRRELTEMILESKSVLQNESRFANQPQDTIFQQGYLSFPEQATFFSSKRYYCLFKNHEMMFYSNSTQAARGRSHSLKQRFCVTQVQDCNSLTRQQKFMLWGGAPPLTLSLMFFVIKANGERVLLAADTRTSKRNWVNTLSKVNYTEAILNRPSKSYTSTSTSITTTSTSTSLNRTTRVGSNSSGVQSTIQEGTPACTSASVPVVPPIPPSPSLEEERVQKDNTLHDVFPTTSSTSSSTSSDTDSHEEETSPTDSSNQVLLELEEETPIDMDDDDDSKSEKAEELSPVSGDTEEEEERLSDGREGNNNNSNNNSTYHLPIEINVQ